MRDGFTVTAPAVLGPAFWGWLAAQGEKVTLKNRRETKARPRELQFPGAWPVSGEEKKPPGSGREPGGSGLLRETVN